MKRGLLGCVLGAWCTVWAGPALASHPDVEAGKAAFLKGEFRQSLAKLEEASRSPNATEDDLVEVHWYRGASFHALGKKADADKEFDALLVVRPLYTPNKLETPPDIRAAFKKRVDAYNKAHGITVATPAVQGATLSAALEGPGLGDAGSVVFFARAAGDVQYVQAAAPVENGRATGTLSDVALWERAGKALQLQVVVEVRNARGTPVARAGDAVQPLSLTLTAEQAQAAVKALTPEKAPPPKEEPKTEPAANNTPTTTTDAPASAPAGEKPSVMRTVLLATGGVLLGLAALPGLLAVLCVAGLVGSAALFGFTYYQFTQYGADKQRDALTQRWTLGQYGTAGFGVAVAASILVVTLLAVPGVVSLVVRAVL